MASAAAAALKDADPEQARLMGEQVILCTPADEPLGAMSKVDAHLVANGLPLHRAFSLFLFDTRGRMLLQRRAATKVTFPSYWTNTVCSHPLHVPSEVDGAPGAINAAVRKVEHELGITALQPKDVAFLTRVLYRAASCDTWGEHELDYVLFAQRDVPHHAAPNEVSETRYVTSAELRELWCNADKGEVQITPWFRHIVDSVGWSLWDDLLAGGMSAVRLRQDDQIRAFT